MNDRIEQKVSLSKAGFDKFLLNELIDIKATGLTIMDTLAGVIAKQENISFDEAFSKINGKRLLYFNDTIEKVLTDYGEITDSDETPS